METFTVTATIILGLILILLYKLLAPYKHWEKFGIRVIDKTSYWDSVVEVLRTNVHELDGERIKKYGRIHGFYALGQPHLMISEPSIIRDILVKDFQNFRNTVDMSIVVNENDIVNHMMLFSRDEKWKRIRTIISPVFSTGKIKKVMSHISESSKTLLQNLANAEKTGKGIDVSKFYETFSMDVIASVAFAAKIDSYNDPENDFVVNARKFFTPDMKKFFLIIVCPFLMKYLQVPLMDGKASQFFNNATLKVIKERKEGGKNNYNDFIQLLMDASANVATEPAEDDNVSEKHENAEKPYILPKINKVLSPEELMANSIMFFFVGFATTSFTLSFASYLLALNPQCQEKLIEEVDETLRNNGMELSYDAVQNMKYMDMVFSETLRLYPFAVRIIREAEVDYEIKGSSMKIPKKSIVVIPIYAIHHDPEYYPDPEKFDPNRFSPEECAKREPYTYIPFSAGPRNCVGMRFALFEMKTCLAYVLSRFRFRRCSETVVPFKVKARGQIVETTNGITLRVEERTDRVVDFLQ